MNTSMKNNFNKTFPGFKLLFKQSSLPFLLLYYLFIFSISNYTESVLLIKLFSSILIFVFWNDIKVLYFKTNSKKIIISVGIILFYLFITVLYSKNIQFGFIKLSTIVVSYIPLIIATYMVFNQKSLASIFLYLLIFVSSAGTIIALIIAPFDYSTVYSFSLQRWSHVVFGRIIGLALLINVYLILSRYNGITRIYIQISLQLLSIGLLFSGARGAILLSFLGILVLTLFVKSLLYNKLALFIQIFVSVILFMLIVPSHNRIVEMNGSLLNKQITDSSVLSRIESYQIALERWGSSPVIGIGLGGFNTFYKSDLPQKMIYPHNMLLETLVELGLVGIILFLTFLLSLLTKLWKIRHEFTIFFLYAFGLAMLSKDLASSPMLFAFVAIYFLKEPSSKKIILIN